MATYQVIAECAHVTVDGGLRLVYKGAPVPDGQDPARLQHLIDSKLVKEVDFETTVLAPNAAIVPEENATKGGARIGPDGQVKPPVEKVAKSAAEVKQAAAKAKLPADGSPPHHNAGDDVLVEYLVVKGYSRTEAEKADRNELRKLVGDSK